MPFFRQSKKCILYQTKLAQSIIQLDSTIQIDSTSLGSNFHLLFSDKCAISEIYLPCRRAILYASYDIDPETIHNKYHEMNVLSNCTNI